MIKKVALLATALLALSWVAWAGGESWKGTVSDEHCGAKHATANAQAATCAEKCASGGAKYVLVAEGKVYQLDPQDKFKGMGGKSVKVSGTLKGETIAAEAVEPAS